MRARSLSERITRFARFVYLKLFRINDTPQRIAIGFGLGVFSGVLPGTGPIAALFLAFLFRVNRASALLGSLLTNTWISVPVFLLAVKAGALLTGATYQDIRAQWDLLVRDFRWEQLWSLSAFKMIGPVLIGYCAVSMCIGVCGYAAALAAISAFKKQRRSS